jgi:hypothetical protein
MFIGLRTGQAHRELDDYSLGELWISLSASRYCDDVYV